MDEKYIVAFEIGSSKIRGALAAVDNSGILNIIAVHDQRTIDSVRFGQVKNIDDVSAKVLSICQKLENARNIQPRKIQGVYIGISACSVATEKASHTADFNIDTEIDLNTIMRLKERIEAAQPQNSDTYDLLPIEFVVDNESTLNPVGRVGRSIKATFNVIHGNPAIKANLNRVFNDRLSLQTNGYIVSALAQADMVLTPDEKQLGCVFVDFGAETTTVVIYKKGVIRSLVTLPMGSRNITLDLVSLNHLEEHAESIKRSIGIISNSDKADSHNIEQPEINNYISARAGEIIANVIARIEFAGLKAADIPSGFIIVGGGARLKGLSDLLATQSKMKVRMGTNPRNVRISDTSISPDEITDVMALLLKAADNNPKECVTPLPVEPAITTPAASLDSDYQQAANDPFDPDSDFGTSRIGRLDDDDDDPLDDDDDKKHRNHKKTRRETEKPAKQTSRNIIDSIRHRLGNFFNDDARDSYNDGDLPSRDNNDDDY